MKKRTMVATTMAFGLTLAVAAPVCADSTYMDVGGCRIGCASTINAEYGVGTTANGNSSVRVSVSSTLKSKKGTKYKNTSGANEATGTTSVKVSPSNGYTPKRLDSHHTAKAGSESGTANTSASR